LLSARIVDQERDFAFDVYLTLFLCNLLFLLGDRFGTTATAIFNNIFNTPKEGRMAMQIHFSFVRLVPLCIEKKISCITELLDPLGVKVLSVGNGEGMIVTDILLGQPISDLVLMIVFDVAMENLVLSVDLRAAALLSPLIEISLAGRGGR
jgi:hypothetical protein